MSARLRSSPGAGSPAPRGDRPATSPARRAVAQRVGATQHAGLVGHRALQPGALGGHVERSTPRPVRRRRRCVGEREVRPADDRSSLGAPSTARIAPVAPAPSMPACDRLDHPRRRTPCPRAASSTRGGWRRARRCSRPRRAAHRPGSDGGAVEVGDDAAALVVGGRGDGQPVGGRVEPDRRERGRDRREALGEVLEPGGVEPHVVDALVEHARGDRPGHDVAGQQLVDEALAVGVAEQRAVAPQRLRQQRPRHRGVVQRGRVELEELEVGDGHPGPERHGDAVAGGHDRVRRDREQLARPAGGEQHVCGARTSRRRRRRRAR